MPLFCSCLLGISLVCLLHYALIVRTHEVNVEYLSHAGLSNRISLDQLVNISRVSMPADQTVSDPFELLDVMQPEMDDNELILEKARLTAILPVTSTSLPLLSPTLHSLLEYPNALSEIVLVSPTFVHPEVRKAVLSVLLSEKHPSAVELSMVSWPDDSNEDYATLNAARQVTTEFVMILDQQGLQHIDSHTREALILLEPFSTALPIGPRGFTSVDEELVCLSPSQNPQPAAFLLPPFVMRSSLLSDTLEWDNTHDVWPAMGLHISQSRNDTIGGFVVGSRENSFDWCCNDLASSVHANTDFPVTHDEMNTSEATSGDTCLAPSDQKSVVGNFILIFSSIQELRSFSSAACGLQKLGHSLHGLLISSPNEPSIQGSRVASDDCLVQYDIFYEHTDAVGDWVNCQPLLPDVVITSFSEDALSKASFSHISTSVGAPLTFIHIPSDDLPFCDWMGSLTLIEIQNWHVPRIDISVITNDRPHSLARLLSSLSNARYFGDSLNVRVNMEQTTDIETLQIVDNFAVQWERGQVFLHRRVIHGGLLPAVVESWYPHSNDSYGLILEDDVEVSPLFYAWLKFTLLRYRYGRPEDRSSQLFGISLYQQKHLELRPEGRHLFNARNSFAAAGLEHPDTPYLSQIPCSWGALYFPEQWREFHSYLTFRLSEYLWDADQLVVPGVRSNKWTRSWKKYFIELVYLRGYVMLYPNYDDYISLSTNHLEVGSHVKDVPLETYLRKKSLFLLPLMQLPDLTKSNATKLLDLPGQNLPPWYTLPLLDLLGTLASEETLIERGQKRRLELTGCSGKTGSLHDVWDLLCLREPFEELGIP